MRRSGVRIPLAPPQADIRSGCRFFVCLGAGAVPGCCVARGAAGVPGAVGPGRCMCRWAAARPRDRHTRAWRLGVVDLEARPCPPVPPAPSTPAALCRCACLGASSRSPARPAAAHEHRTLALPASLPVPLHPGACTLIAESTINFACNSPTTLSNHEFRLLVFQRFQTLLKLLPIELHATLGDGGLVGLRWGLGA